MKKISPQLVVTAACLSVALAACATKPTPPPPPKKPSAATLAAIAAAKKAVARAERVGCQTQSEQSLINEALAAARAKVPDNMKAQQLAGKARHEADACVNRHWLAKAKALLRKIKNYTNLNAHEQNELANGEADIENGRGRAAYDTLSRLLAELKAAETTYTVVRGNSLWAIAGKSSIYGNPFEWPLIYRSNASKIHDPDLIYPHERLKIVLNPVKSAVRSAVHYARTRGPWRNGQALPKDRAWLRSQQGTPF
jgi:nucleoid-associated protein YgaU